ncbi:MAG: DUF4421 domain-containing protein [Spirochaetes bacterium]|nr:MAG: DUF4421 domain-containing protein [Spirochaetota bacterium]
MRQMAPILCMAILVMTATVSQASDEAASIADAVSISAALSRQSHTFSISETDSEHEIPYETNVTWDLGIRTSYLGAALGFSVDAPWSRGVEDKGQSDYYAVEGSYFRRSFGAEASWKRYHGFYVPRDSLRNPVNHDYPQQPNLTCTNAGLYLYYFFDERFSYRAAFQQTERAHAISSSFILMGFSTFSRNESDRSLILPSESTYFEGLSGLESFRFISTGLSGGYAFSIPRGPFFLSSALLFGDAVQHQRFYTTGKTINRVMAWNPSMLLRVAAGYTGDTYFGGMLFTVDSNQTHYRRVRIDLLTVQFSINSGTMW